MRFITKLIQHSGGERMPRVSISADNVISFTQYFGVVADDDSESIVDQTVTVPADPAILGERYDHAAYELVLNNPDDPADATYRVDNVFKKTLPNRELYHNLSRPAGSFGFIVVPFKDSTPDEWMFVTNVRSYDCAANVIVDVVATINDDNVDSFSHDEAHGTCIRAIDLLPKIALTLEDGAVGIQLVDGEGNNIARAGVEIYLETTSGALSASRVFTDANGAATATISGHANGKLKAGFKYWAGKTDLFYV